MRFCHDYSGLSSSDHEVISTTERDFQIIFQIVAFRSLIASASARHLAKMVEGLPPPQNLLASDRAEVLRNYMEIDRYGPFANCVEIRPTHTLRLWRSPQGNNCFAIAAPPAARIAHFKTMARR